MGRLERLAYKRAERDAIELPALGYYFDEDEAERIIVLAETHFYNAKGKWGGELVILEPWEKFLLSQIFGWKRPDGKRRFRLAYLQVARKNGKSFLAAIIGLILLLADNENIPEIYTAAPTLKQSRFIFEDAWRMVDASPELKGRCTLRQHAIMTGNFGGVLRPLAADTHSLDGLNTHGGLVDEVHRIKVPADGVSLWDALETSTGAREQSLILGVTTAGAGKAGVCWDQRKHAVNILEGTVTDNAFFACIFEPDEGDDWRTRTTWEKANPNLDITVDSDQIAQKAKRAEESPRLQNAFRRLHCNEWTETISRWIDSTVWKDCAGPTSYMDLPDKLEGKRCWVGLDLSQSQDLTSMVAAFPIEDRKVALIQKSWIPEEGLRKRVEQDRVPYDEWLEEGLIETTPGNIIDLDYIMNQLIEWNMKFQIVENLFDPFLAMQFSLRCQEQGLTMLDHRQGCVSMNEPVRSFERLALGRRFVHGGDPLLSWSLANVCIAENASGLLKPDKRHSEERIDPIVAAIMAVGRAQLNIDGGRKRSRYESGAEVIAL